MVATIIFIVLISIFYCSLYFGKSLTPTSEFITSLGKNIYTNKLNLYKTSSFFIALRSAIKQRSITKSILFIFPLIVLKSVAFYFISILLITPLIIIFQGITMGSFFLYHKKQGENINELASITFWQILSHLIAATYGCLVGIDWLFNKDLLTGSSLSIQGNIKYYIFLSLVTACIAAYLEVKSLLKKV